MHSWDMRLQDVRRLLRNSSGLELSDAAVQRLKWFVYALEHDGNISLACRHFGIARSTFLRWKERFNARDIRTLEEESRRPHTVRSPEADAETIAIIRLLRERSPMMGKESVQQILTEKYGKEISSSTVGRIIERHAFFFGDTPAHRRKRREFAHEEVAESVTLATPDTDSPTASDTPPFLPFPSEPGLPA